MSNAKEAGIHLQRLSESPLAFSVMSSSSRSTMSSSSSSTGNVASTAGNLQARAPSAPSAESARIRNDVDAARNTALSALNNDRFRVMLEQISDLRASSTLMTMSADSNNNAGTDFNTALSRYDENSK